MASDARTLGQQVADVLREEIRRQCAPGDRFPTDRELAERFEVSVLSIREAISALVHEGLLVRRRRAGTFIRKLPPRRYVGIICLDIAQPGCSFFYRDAVQKLRLFLNRHDVPTRMYIGLADPADPGRREPGLSGELREDIGQERLCGAAAVTMNSDEMQRFLTVCADNDLAAASTCDVHIDYDEMTRLGVERLVARGARRLAVFGPGNYIPAFTEAVAEAGAETAPHWTRNVPAVEGGAGWDEFLALWARPGRKPDGLLVLDDVVFESTAKAILSAGADVPGDLHVVTHANRGSGMLLPFPVDRLEIDPTAWAEAMGRRLLDRLAGEAEPEGPVVIRAQLRPREARPLADPAGRFADPRNSQ